MLICSHRCEIFRFHQPQTHDWKCPLNAERGNFKGYQAGGGPGALKRTPLEFIGQSLKNITLTSKTIQVFVLNNAGTTSDLNLIIGL